MKRPNYFDDGCTLAGYIAPDPQLYDQPLRFTYRPVLTAERSRLVDSASGQSTEAYDHRAADLVAEKLLSWNLLDSAGQEVPISADALLRLQTELFLKLHRIVLGWTPSDVDPEWSAEQASEHLADAREAVGYGQTIGEVREARHEKN